MYSGGRIAVLTQKGDTKRPPPYRGLTWGDRPIEAGSRKALPGVLGVRFSGDTGRITKALFGLRAAGANTLMKAYHHVWSRGTGCLASYKVGFVLWLSCCAWISPACRTLGGPYFLFCYVPRRLSLLGLSAVHMQRDAVLLIHHKCAGGTSEARSRKGCTVHTLVIECTTVL